MACWALGSIALAWGAWLGWLRLDQLGSQAWAPGGQVWGGWGPWRAMPELASLALKRLQPLAAAASLPEDALAFCLSLLARRLASSSRCRRSSSAASRSSSFFCW